MSYRKEKEFSLTGFNYDGISPEQTHELFLENLKNGMHGLCFSAYEEDQEPGHILSIEQRNKLHILKVDTFEDPPKAPKSVFTTHY